MAGRILAMGGFSLGTDFDDLILELAGGPRILFVPTAAGSRDNVLLPFYTSFARRAEARHVDFFPWPPAELRQVVLAQDAVYVSGGNTANALAIWRTHGFDAILREAWERDILLCGWSAGMICWFEAGVTDSFGPELAGMRDGLGFLPGSACPHYDGEERRRPVYEGLVREGFPPGIACDDAAAVLYEGTELAEVIAREAGARAYRLGPEGEETLLPGRL
ncbi:MAG TPA: peptidase E [Gaiella sp.]|uniref:Type 1 glutamine amidotransferase-like domain-containing protein n=1 Tax=Gaiella sp. TaxID=2663207 RepID=UPI002D80FEEE|nr:peptidase E [Gaiella sp.]HET9287706.1 peptidase E [Gaiella sp.]